LVRHVRTCNKNWRCPWEALLCNLIPFIDAT
jgi:hypothetical protein